MYCIHMCIDTFLHRHMYSHTCMHVEYTLYHTSFPSMVASGILGTPTIKAFFSRQGGGTRELLFQESPFKKNVFGVAALVCTSLELDSWYSCCAFSLAQTQTLFAALRDLLCLFKQWAMQQAAPVQVLQMKL